MKNEKKSNETELSRDKIDILYEDDFICVINKPAGLLSVPYPGSKGKTALSYLEDLMRKNGSYSSKHRPFAVHRLDKETSGVMMFALSEAAQTKIMDSWHKMVTERLYRAVAENPKNPHKFLPLSGIIDEPLAFNSNNQGFVPKKEKKSRFSENKTKENDFFDTKEKHFKTISARTEFKTILRGKTHTLFELSLDTGRKNQIRAHLSSKGYPLAGDENYRARTDYFNRLCLHATTLAFAHPYTNQNLLFEVAEPEEWKKYVEKGDFKPLTPSWRESTAKDFDFSKTEIKSTKLTAKQKAHMDFIQRGKAFGKR